MRGSVLLSLLLCLLASLSHACPCGECFDCQKNQLGEDRCVRRPGCCPDGKQADPCERDPCEDAQTDCPLSRVCVADCEACQAHYYDGSLNKLTEDQCKDSKTKPQCTLPCPLCHECKLNRFGEQKCVRERNCCMPGAKGALCAMNPCSQLSFECRKARYCIPTYCNSCKANYYDDKLNLLSNDEQCGNNDADPKIMMCSHRSDVGTGSDEVIRYYFERTTQSCYEFAYSGSGGNENNFETQEECEEACDGVPACPVSDFIRPPAGCRHIVVQRPDGCFMPQVQCGTTAAPTTGTTPETRPSPPTTRAPSTRVPMTPKATESPPPETERLCRQDSDVGSCGEAKSEAWFYNKMYAECQTFQYSGCGGNTNRFATKEDCENTCADVRACPVFRVAGPPPGCHHEQVTRINGCTHPTIMCPEAGCGTDPCPKCHICENTFPDNCHERWDIENCRPTGQKCIRDEFCEKEACAQLDCPDGSKCSFDGERGAECVSEGPKTTAPPKSTEPPQQFTTTEPDVPETARMCRQDSDVGSCGAGRTEAWFYNKMYAECQTFQYSGCGGNTNRFATKEDCENTCAEVGACPVFKVAAPPSGCHHEQVAQIDGCPKPTIMCPENGCGTDPCPKCHVCENVFPSSCYKKWDIETCRPTGQYCNRDEFCEKQACAKIYCRDGFKCEFDGERGAECVPEMEKLEQIRLCRLSADSGPCEAAMPKFYYDKMYGQCRNFSYGGCDGNKNRFDSKEQCMTACSAIGGQCPIPGMIPAPDDCHYDFKSISLDGCGAYTMMCPDSGCGTNPCNECEMCENTFPQNCDWANQECKPDGHKCTKDPVCEKWKCEEKSCPSGAKCIYKPGQGAQCVTEKVPLSTVQQCRQRKNAGTSCAKLKSMWFYNPTRQVCEKFLYAGCGGNENRFETSEECMQQCGNVSRCISPPMDRAHEGCQYKRYIDENGCSQFELICDNSSSSEEDDDDDFFKFLFR